MKQEWIKTFGLFYQIVTELVVSTGLGLGLGYLLVKKLGAPDAVIIFCTLIGFAGAMYRLYRMMLKQQQKDDS
jgi:F0F1-type ATP synthase assembly protein I